MSSKAEPQARWTAGLASLIRAEPMRRALQLVAIFAATLVVTLAIAFWFRRADAVAMIDRENREWLAAFAAAENRDDFDRLLAAEAAVAAPADRIVIFIDGAGRQSGNAMVQLQAGDLDFEPLSNGRPVAEAYRSLVTPMHGGVLVIARSPSLIVRLAETFVALIALTVIPTTVVAVGSAIAISARSSRRMVRIAGALERMTHGDLSARVGHGGSDELGGIEAAIDRMAEAQEKAIWSLRQVTADVAHELRTPLQRIGVHLAELAEATDETARRTLIDRAMEETEASVAIFQSLLRIAQIEGGGVVLHRTRFDATRLVAEFVELYRPAAEDRGISLTGPAPPPPRMWIDGDEALVGQAVANLIENALRHSEGRSIACQVEEAEGSVAIIVADSGVGIPSGEREKVFDRLYRLERSRTTSGSGLGLSLVKAVVEAHGGTVRLEDADPGLKCILTFPAADGEDEAGRQEAIG
jgi:signal transduction histidine kinase